MAPGGAIGKLHFTFVHTGPTAMSDRRPVRRKRRKPAGEIVGVLALWAVAVAGAGLTAGAVYDELSRRQGQAEAAQTWKPARLAVADRLKQHEPLEFGAVWATHSGLICGLVNGWGSFGGLTGMTPFAVERNRAIFPFDVGAMAFAPYWRACIKDQWITVLDGSMQTGYCATKRGQLRCVR